MKKKKRKKHKKTLKSLCDGLMFLFTLQQRRTLFVTVILPIWTTCCKHPEGTKCY